MPGAGASPVLEMHYRSARIGRNAWSTFRMRDGSTVHSDAETGTLMKNRKI